MKLRLALLVPAVAVVLAGCGSQASSRTLAPSPPVTPAPSLSSAATGVSYADTTACGAFTEATTGGAPAGQNPLAWLQSQAAGAYPRLSAAVAEYVLAREVNPGEHPAEIRRLAGEITRMCAGGV